jgi:DNA-binding PadR family transcriptional regulator
MFWAGRGFGRGVWTERISPVEFLVLLLLSEEPTHGYDIMQRLGEKFSGLWAPKPGTVYPALSRLEDKNLIRLKEAETKQEGAQGQVEYLPKKVYALTEKGAETLKDIIGKMDFEEKLMGRFMRVVDHSAWMCFDNLALKRLEGAIERALMSASQTVEAALQALSPQDSVRELEAYRDQLKAEYEKAEKKLADLKEKEKKYRKVEVE